MTNHASIGKIVVYDLIISSILELAWQLIDSRDRLREVDALFALIADCSLQATSSELQEL